MILVTIVTVIFSCRYFSRSNCRNFSGRRIISLTDDFRWCLGEIQEASEDSQKESADPRFESSTTHGATVWASKLDVYMEQD